MSSEILTAIGVSAIFLLCLFVIVCLVIAMKRVLDLNGKLEASQRRVTDLEAENQSQQEELQRLRNKLRRAETADRASLIDWAEEKARAAFLEGQLRVLAALRLIITTVTQTRLRGLLKDHFYQIRLMIGERTLVDLMIPAPGASFSPVNLIPGLGVDVTGLLR